MCIGVWTLEHPQYALILCSNRDEFLERPTLKAHFHNFGTKTEDQSGDILSGLDERAGGTWLGLNRNGKVASLMNITGETLTPSTSRGSLVSSFLLSDPTLPLEEETAKLVAENGKYSGFTILFFTPRLKSDGSLTYESALVTNHGAGGVLTSRLLSANERCCGGISNGIDGAGTADWPKIDRITQDFDAALKSLPPCPSEDELVDRLMEVLAWRCDQPMVVRTDQRKTIQVTPFKYKPSEDHAPIYGGTRMSTVILIRRDGQVRFVERDIWQLLPDEKVVLAPPSSARVFQFKLGINQGLSV